MQIFIDKFGRDTNTRLCYQKIAFGHRRQGLKLFSNAFCQCSCLPAEEKNRNRGLIQCLREGDYHGLTYYEDRENLYRYWSIHGEKKKGIIRGGIQCIKDSGLKYTVKLFFRKLFSMRV